MAREPPLRTIPNSTFKILHDRGVVKLICTAHSALNKIHENVTGSNMESRRETA